jgi:hypothetical protein
MKLVFLASLVLIGSGTIAGAKASHSDLKWMAAPPSLPSGAQMAVVSGDPGKKGMFKIQLKMPANYAVPPHSHPTNEVVKVLSGTLHYGMGDKLMAGAKTLRGAHSVVMKANMHHWVHAPAAATIQVSGRGPFQITYVDPKDDPRK